MSLIVLNGTSSSGKTSLAIELQKQLPALWLNFSIDSVLYTLPNAELNQMIAGQKITRQGYDYSKLVKGYNQALAGLLAAENNIISDNALVNTQQKEELRRLVSPFPTLWVGVTCDLAELQRRERKRGDRAIGTAEREFPNVHTDMDYDIMVDTTHNTSADLAATIGQHLGHLT